MANCVKVLNNEGKFLCDIGREGPGELDCPTWLAVDNFDNLVVYDQTENVQGFTMEGKFVNSIIRQVIQLQNPLAVAVSNATQVFIIGLGKHCDH